MREGMRESDLKTLEAYKYVSDSWIEGYMRKIRSRSILYSLFILI